MEGSISMDCDIWTLWAKDELSNYYFNKNVMNQERWDAGKIAEKILESYEGKQIDVKEVNREVIDILTKLDRNIPLSKMDEDSSWVPLEYGEVSSRTPGLIRTVTSDGTYGYSNTARVLTLIVLEDLELNTIVGKADSRESDEWDILGLSVVDSMFPIVSLPYEMEYKNHLVSFLQHDIPLEIGKYSVRKVLSVQVQKNDGNIVVYTENDIEKHCPLYYMTMYDEWVHISKEFYENILDSEKERLEEEGS